jgi:tetratricopeptide (TPR) repeat protein
MVFAYFYEGKFKEAEEILNEMLPYCHDYDCNLPSIYIFPGLIQIVNGDLNSGYKELEKAHLVFRKNDSKYFCAMMDNIFGNVLLNIAENSAPEYFASMAKNIDFPIQNLPDVVEKAEVHFRESIEISTEIRTKFLLAQTYFSLGLLHKFKKKSAEARKNISNAIQIYERMDSEGFLKQAKAALATLE